MTLRGFYGFDDTVLEPEITLGSSASVNTSPVRTGLRALTMSTSYSTIAPPGLSASGVVAGLAYIITTISSAQQVIAFREGATVHCGVGFDTSRHLTIYGPAGTVVATSTATYPTTLWDYIEAKATIADAGGTVEVKVGGTVVVSYTGDTRNGGTGVVDTIGYRAPNTSASCAMDDLYILDTGGSAPYNTYLGDVVVRTQLPTGNGDSSDWVGSDGNSTDNYLLVDEANSSSADYVGTALTGKTDLYQFADIPGTDVPLATQTLVYAGKSDAGTPPVMKPVTKGDGGTVLEESAITLSTTYAVFEGAIRTTDPDGDTLTATNVNAMQVGVRSA